MENRPKVIVIGLDGATWDLIKPWTDEGKLPTFKYLMKNGAWGVLGSTIPPLSPSAWVSIYTGCKPSKHGIFGFVKRKKKSYFYRPISSKDVNVPTVWEILSEFGLKSVIINALFMYPPKPINGVLITGLGTPSQESDFVYPKSYREFILKNFPKYNVDFNEDLLLVSNNAKAFVSRIKEVTEEQIRLTCYFIKNGEWDFLFSIFRALDVVQHYFWEDKQLIYSFYRVFDDFIGNLLADLKDENFVLFIVSDHGFAPVKKYFCVNNWLEQIGLLKTMKRRRKSLVTAESIKKVLLKLGMRNLVWKLKRNKMLEKLLKIIPSEELSYVHEVKWNETKAYFYEGSDGIINVNLAGREPSGIVTMEEYDSIVKYIISKLEELKDSETGEKIVEKVYTKKELFNTKDKKLPDIFILIKDGYRTVAYNKIDSRSIFMPPIHGRILRPADHHINGIFIAYGWNVVNKRLEDKVKVWDIAPTILHILGVPRVAYMDGQTLTNIFHRSVSERSLHCISLERIRKKIKELRGKL